MEDRTAPTIEVVGVVGAGVMGRGVAEALLLSGLRVILHDIDVSALQGAYDAVRNDLRTRRLLGGRTTRPDVRALLGNLTTTSDSASLAGADFVIENATERLEIKRDIYRQLDSVCPPHVVFAANTSTIPVDELAGFSERPAAIIGTHFMNPAQVKPTVEVIRGRRTSDATVATTIGLLSRIGKASIVVKDAPGFVSNRVLMLTLNEAIRVVESGLAPAEDVDRIFVECFGHTMGPLATADLIGLDTVLLSLESLCLRLKEAKFEPCPLLRTMVAAHRHGRKSGRGFFEYDVEQ